MLECLVLDSEPSMYSLYANLKHYISTAISYEWNMDLKTYHDPKKLPTQNQLNFNLNNYIISRREFVNSNGLIIKNRELEYDTEFKIIKQFDIGETFKTGSYDRYVPFKNFPDANWICTIYKMGLVQIAGNPLKTFYNDEIYYLPNRRNGDLKTVAKLDLNNDANPDVSLVKDIMNKLYSTWSHEEKQEMSMFKIPGLKILETTSGGHPSITNIQGINYLDERRDAIHRYFGSTVIPVYNIKGELVYKYIQNYEDLMVFFANEYLTLLKNKLQGKDIEINTDIKLLGNTSEVIG